MTLGIGGHHRARGLPSPYYERDGIAIYHGDCREILPLLVSESPSLVTDPPYGIALSNNDVDGHRSDRSFAIAGDGDRTAGEFALNWAADFPSIAFASPWLPWPGKWRNLIVWDKGGAVGGGGDPERCLKRTWELIQIRNNGPILGGRAESVWRVPIIPSDTSLHICAKPAELMCRLIHCFTSPTSTIVDPFCGSGSTLVAAKIEGRRAIGIEIDEQNCEIAARRLAQGVLFSQNSTPLNAGRINHVRNSKPRNPSAGSAAN